MKKLNHLENLKNLPLSTDQKRLWIINQQDKLNPAYNLVLTYHFKGEINIEDFRKSMDVMFNRKHSGYNFWNLDISFMG